MQEQLTTLEFQLQEKEQLINALTERLEQAAEQLDRLRRSGADKALRTGGGIPPEMVEEQKQLVGDMQRVLQQWEDMQPGALLGRVETQLGELRDLVSSSGTGGFAAAFTGSDRHGNQTRSPDRDRGGHADASRSPSSGSSAYEAMKAGLMAGESTEDKPCEEEAETDAEPTPPVPTGPEFEDARLTDPPPALDLDQAPIEDLRQAVTERDSYIMYILGRLRNAETRHHVRNDWAKLSNVPEDLRARLEVLEKQLEHSLRTAEVELSLERAKLGREEARLRMLDEQVQKKMQRAGIKETLAGEAVPEREKSPAARWMRMLDRYKGKT